MKRSLTENGNICKNLLKTIKNLVNSLVSKHFKIFIDEHLVEKKNQRIASKELKLSVLKEFVEMFKNSKTYPSKKKSLHIFKHL